MQTTATWPNNPLQQTQRIYIVAPIQIVRSLNQEKYVTVLACITVSALCLAIIARRPATPTATGQHGTKS